MFQVASSIFINITNTSNQFVEHETLQVTILSQLTEYSHPNIVKLFGDYEPQDGDDCYICMRALVLSLARGPPLTFILKQKGSLGLPIAQKISSQLVNTVAFLHGLSYSS
jgi:serine/threonine protein kinase